MSLWLFKALSSRFEPVAEGLTRREMLRTSLAAAGGLFLREHLAHGAQARKVGKRVIVIGAGFAGTSAAHELHTAGYEVTVIEARNRLGGRVLTMDDGFVKNKTVEAGGELIGANHPAWIAYAKQLGLKLVEIAWNPQAEVPIVLGGQKLTADESKALWEEMSRGLSMMNDDARKVNADEPWKSDNAKQLDRQTTAQWIAGLAVSDRCKQAIAVQWTAINGMLPAWQSYLGNLAMVKGGGVEKYWTETDSFHCEDGAQQLAEELADDIGEGFRLGTPVTAVKATDKQVSVTLADGTSFEGDDVVVAVPVSTWNRIAFDPPLPGELTPQMGTNTKYLVSLRRRFWNDLKLSHRSLSDGPVQLTWEATFGQPGEEGACLTAYTGGPPADSLIGMKPDERNKLCLEALGRLYPELRRHYVNARFVNWLADPYSKGTYSFPAPGQVTTIGPIVTSSHGRLHFAGEHCSYAFIGYMEGALQSGIGVAKRLAQRDGVVKRT